MSDGFSMRVDEDDLRDFIGKLDGLSAIDFGLGLWAGGLVVEAAGKENIIYYDFIDTGATLNTTAAEMVGDTEVHIGPETEYAIFGELGIGQSEKPFMREAIDMNRDTILQAIANTLRGLIRGAAS